MSTTGHGRVRAHIASRRRAGFAAVIGLSVILVAGCGGSGGAASPAPSTAAATVPTATATATPSATPAPTASPTAEPTTAAPALPSELPSEIPGTPDPAANGGFAFAAQDVFDYYTGEGYACADPTASTQARDYKVHRCTKTDAKTGYTLLVALVLDPTGVTGDAFAGVVDSSGKVMPANSVAIEPLAFFLGAMLGETDGTRAATWVAPHLGEESAQTKQGTMTVATYTNTGATGKGIFVEVANQAFMDAPAP